MRTTINPPFEVYIPGSDHSGMHLLARADTNANGGTLLDFCIEVAGRPLKRQPDRLNAVKTIDGGSGEPVARHVGHLTGFTDGLDARKLWVPEEEQWIAERAAKPVDHLLSLLNVRDLVKIRVADPPRAEGWVAGIVEGETERGTLALEEGSDFRASPVDLAATGWFAIYGALQGTDPGEVQAYRISGAFSQGEHHPF